jgi:hypothetical protein
LLDGRSETARDVSCVEEGGEEGNFASDNLCGHPFHPRRGDRWSVEAIAGGTGGPLRISAVVR